MPVNGVPLSPKDNILTNDEVVKLVKVFAENGIDKVRLTGGEPTLRRDLDKLICEFYLNIPFTIRPDL